MSNLFKKIYSFLQKLLHKQASEVQATPVAPAPAAPVVAPSSPAPAPVASAPETFAQWLQRVHPDLFMSSLGAYQLAVNPYLAKGMSNEDAFKAAITPKAPEPVANPDQPVPFQDWGHPTPATSLTPLQGEDLDMIHSASRNTEAYDAAVAYFRNKGMSENDIAGYIKAYNPGGMWYGK